jgi:trans-aconitate 2-methyltransferase
MANHSQPELHWDADLLLHFEAEREQVVHDLIARVPGAPGTIVDLGCGPGTSTRLLAQRFPQARLTGLDNSEEMLAVARARVRDASFVCADIRKWRPEAPVDLVFADSALQWIEDHQNLLARLMEWLAPGGVLAVQMPDNRQEPSHALMRLIAADGPWADRLVPVAKTRAVIADYEEYYRWLRPLTAALDIWQTTYVHALDGIEAIVDWFRSSALRPFLAPLSIAEREQFLARYRRDLSDSYEAEADGKVLFVYPRLFLLARKGGRLG